MKLLLNSIKAAQEVAYILRGNWDSCNGVEFLAHDCYALKLAAALRNAEYCEVGNACNILDDIRESKSVLMIGFSDTVTQAIASQMAGCFNQNLHSGNEGFWQLALKVAEDVEQLGFAAAGRLGRETL